LRFLATIAAVHQGNRAAAGEHVLFCMVTGRDGRSHIEHGMIQRLRID